MQAADAEFFRVLLRRMLDDILRTGHTTMEEMENAGSTALPDPSDQAGTETQRGFTLRLRDREYRMMRKIRQALGRIEDGSFGLCEECGEAIALARLRARPVATLCIDCKNAQERHER